MREEQQDRDGAEHKRRADFEALVAEQEAGLLRYAARVLGDGSAAKDIVQEAFARLFQQGRASRTATASPAAWLYRVTHNLAVDHIRRESRLRSLHSEHAAERQGTAPPIQRAVAEQRELAALVWRHLRTLKPREQQVVILRVDEGKSYREIAQIMDLSEGNVGFILHHALKKLSKSLRQAGVI